MPNHRRLAAALAVLGLLTAGATVAVERTGGAGAATTGLGDWPAYERNVAHSSAAFGTTTLTASTAQGLHAVWQWKPPAGDLEASPIVTAGVVYIGTGGGTFYALDAVSGAVRWSKTLDVGVAGHCKAKGIEATATVANDPVTGKPTVYAEGARYVYALDAATGSLVWRHIVGPTTSSSFVDYYNWSSPTVAGGHVYVGLSSRCDNPLIRGGELAFDQHTGALKGSYYDMPSGHTGGSIWSSAAYWNGSLWVTTGNPDANGTYDSYSIVKLNGTTMAKVAKWTVPNLTAAQDADFGSSPVLFSNSGGTRYISACNKNGSLYAWNADHVDAGPVWTKHVSTHGQCLTTPAWDYQGRVLYMATDGTTLSNGTAVQGSALALNPDTGATRWQSALPCEAFGSPTLDQPGKLLAVPLYGCPTGVTPVVELLNTSTGTKVMSLPAPGGAFSQPVFVGNTLYVASFSGGLTAYQP
jgi:polyvinyl alcohol dehydrogenase (cytochrome)